MSKGFSQGGRVVEHLGRQTIFIVCGDEKLEKHDEEVKQSEGVEKRGALGGIVWDPAVEDGCLERDSTGECQGVGSSVSMLSKRWSLPAPAKGDCLEGTHGTQYLPLAPSTGCGILSLDKVSLLMQKHPFLVGGISMLALG